MRHQPGAVERREPSARFPRGAHSLVAPSGSLSATRTGAHTTDASREGHPPRSPPQPGPSSGGPSASLQHEQTSRGHTRGSNPHSQASLEQLASPTQHQETSFQHDESALERLARSTQYKETSFQQLARLLEHKRTPLQRPERLRVVATRSRVVPRTSRLVARSPAEGLVSPRDGAKTLANVASRLREGPERAADGREEGTGSLAGPELAAAAGRAVPGTRAAGRRPRRVMKLRRSDLTGPDKPR